MMKPEIISGSISRSKKALELRAIHTIHNGIQVVLKKNGEFVTLSCSGNGSYENDPQESIIFAIFRGAGLAYSKVKVLYIETQRDNRELDPKKRSIVKVRLEYKGKDHVVMAKGHNMYRATACAVLKIINDRL